MNEKKKLNLSVVLIPTIIILVLGIFITIFPDVAVNTITAVRNFFGNTLGSYYLLFGLAALIMLLYIAFSKIGKTKLGNAKPMKTFTWGALIFTSTMAADILFFAFHEWTYYWNSNIGDVANTATTSSKVLWSETYSLFHWGFIPWAFYLLLAGIYAYHFYKRKKDKRQSLSAMCEPVIGEKNSKGFLGKLIDSTSIVALLLGISKNFSVTTLLITAIVCKVLGLANTPLVSIIILVVIALIYGTAVMIGNKGISVLAKITTVLFSTLLASFFILGGPRFIVENGIQSLGNMLQHFTQMSTWTDPLRASNFPQDWTIFYWAYWLAWCVATPFFIAKISKGRTLKQTLLGGLFCGLLGTFASFIIFSGFGMNLQANGTFDAATLIANGANPAQVIIEMISTSKLAIPMLILLGITMICLYASTFDALTEVVSSFAYKQLSREESPSKKMKLFWIAIFLILPIALLFLDTTNQVLMSLSIIAAFPLTIIMTLIVISFFREVRKEKLKYDKRKTTKNTQTMSETSKQIHRSL